MNSASLCSLAGRYETPIPRRCLAPIDFLKIPALLLFLIFGHNTNEKMMCNGTYLDEVCCGVEMLL